MSKTLTIVEKLSSSQYIGRDQLGKSYRIDSTITVRKGATVRTLNGRVTGVVRAETQTVYEI